ncbi:tyrosine-type recombinase/integrase [Phycicoccus sp. 3266]|uniref:tyrosine-type recombinase/integrase n=1 Tax=Phycicoccus sp. 3266 TaxID=2817751 RepID=UPI002861D464|nr:tyrosine-type recombinase/integrase [Phycicoccus sp. 3266]MDR6861924.1 integrase [Phycicoccus sp. 3266]
MATIDTRTSSKGVVKYRVRWRLGGARDGKWQTATFAKLKGPLGAERFAAKVEACGHQWPDDADTSGALTIPGTETVEQVAEAYLAQRTKRARSDRTPSDYRRDIENWILPTFGGRQFMTITELEVQDWVDGMLDGSIVAPERPVEDRKPHARKKPPARKGGLAPKTIADKHAILSGMFKVASSDFNPCQGTELPPRTRKKPKGIMPAEWTALHRALALIDHDAADVAECLLATGWRWSEVAAVTTHHVEDYGDAMYLNMAQVVRRNAAGQFVIVEDGKADASLRRVKLDSAAADMVRRRLVGKAPGSLVFTTGRVAAGGSGGRANGLGGSQWHYSNFMERYWNPAVEAANLSRRPTPHWLRHTHVGWMVMFGKATLPELQSRIGHASIKTTIDVYGSMLTDVSQTSLDAFAAMRTGSVLPAGTVSPSVERATIEGRPVA